MKKIACSVLALVMLLSFAACVDKNSEADDAADSTDTSSNADKIDIDLTKLSSTMVYSEVYAMMYSPEEYFGKTIKMQGSLDIYTDDSTGKTYYACIISDATACCSQGIEFVLKNEQNYPEIGEVITVVGTFTTYAEGENEYCELIDAEMV